MKFFWQGSKNRLENQLSAKGQHKKLCVVWREKQVAGAYHAAPPATALMKYRLNQ